MKYDLIQFIADKVKLNGPKVDGGYSVTFEVGEYMWDNIKELPKVNGQTIAVAVALDKKDDNKVEDLPKLED